MVASTHRDRQLERERESHAMFQLSSLKPQKKRVTVGFLKHAGRILGDDDH